MRRGRPKKPTISVESIEATLRTLGHRASEVPKAVALQHLALVDLYLENPARPPTEDLRGWALRSLLAKMITEALSEQRHYFELVPASLREKRITAFERIQQDSQSNSNVLLGWSILFYRYVRADLAITVQELADFTNVHERTIRRERHDAILRLRDRVAQAEWEARQINQRRVLQSAIPEKLVKLIERDSELNFVFDTLQESRTAHFFVSGVSGIGKSAFAAAVAHQLVESDSLDFIVWLSCPQSFSDVKNALEDALLPYPSHAELGTVLLEYRTLLVIDDVETLIMNSEQWLEMLRDLNHAIVIICNREHVLFPHSMIHIPIRELSEFGINKLIATYPSVDAITSSQEKQIWQTVGGNPRGIDYILRQIANGKQIHFGDAALRSIYDDLFEKLKDEQRGLWIFLTTLPEGLHADVLSQLSGVYRFFDYGLIEILDEQGKRLQLVPSAKHYIELIVRTNENLSSFTNQQVEIIIEKLLAVSQSASELFLAVLECSWLKIDLRIALKALCACDTRVLTIPQLRRWRQIVDAYNEQNSELLVLKAIATRRLHYHKESFSILENVIQQTGQTGDFVQQAIARYELAVLYQTRAEFDKALGIYQELEAYLPHTANRDLARQVKRQQARIAIEKRNAEKALTYLESYSHATQDGILFCEALLIQGRRDLCRNSAKKYLQDTEDKPILTSSLYTIIGRSYEQEGQIDEALDYFSAALSLTERFSTDFDIARAQSNLASVYLRFEEKQSLDQAEDLLRQAQETQAIIKDAVGLLITERNLEHLHTLRLSR